MPLTNEELERFCDYASARINNGGVDSLEVCLRQWRAAREEDELVADVQESLEDIAAGRVHDVDEVIADIRKDLTLHARDRSA